MNKFLQVSCYAITFALALYVGVFFTFLIPSEQYNLAKDLPGKPLPGILLLFLKNPSIASYLFLYPWLAFVGLPLFCSPGISYWETNPFLLRFSVFVSLEIFLVIFSGTVFFMPYIGILEGMSETPVPLTWIEELTRDGFWLLVLALIVAIIVRAAKSRR